MLDESRKTLRELHAQWWPLTAPELAPKSRRGPSGAWMTHVEPRLGDRKLNELTPLAIERFAADLRAEGVGDGAISKCWDLLRQMLGRAAAWGWIPSNPVLVAKRPKRRQAVEPVTPPGPAQVEALRRGLDEGDACLVSVLAYAGLRPGEALALRWRDVGDDRILVSRAVSLGEVRTTKTGRSRSVPVMKPLAEDLRRWKLASGGRDDDLVFPGRDGAPWDENAYRRFIRGRLRPACESAGIEADRPAYVLRHAAASLKLASGLSVVETADHMGHSPQMLLRTYSHVIRDLAGRGAVDAEAEVRKARDVA